MEAATRGENVELALTLAHDETTLKLRARLNYLSTILTLAPLLGLKAVAIVLISADERNSLSISCWQDVRCRQRRMPVKV